MVDMKDKLLFPSGSAKLSRAAVKVLRDISRILANLPNQIQVEGNTDNRPIHTDEYPSNWELSAARAASVVHLMTRMGVTPNRMSAIGYGEHRPIAKNDTEEGRQKNRRVTLVVMGLNGSPDQTLTLPM
jgi:chemotaxis protein MotB